MNTKNIDSLPVIVVERCCMAATAGFQAMRPEQQRIVRNQVRRILAAALEAHALETSHVVPHETAIGDKQDDLPPLQLVCTAIPSHIADKMHGPRYGVDWVYHCETRGILPKPADAYDDGSGRGSYWSRRSAAAEALCWRLEGMARDCGSSATTGDPGTVIRGVCSGDVDDDLREASELIRQYFRVAENLRRKRP